MVEVTREEREAVVPMLRAQHHEDRVRAWVVHGAEVGYIEADGSLAVQAYRAGRETALADHHLVLEAAHALLIEAGVADEGVSDAFYRAEQKFDEASRG